MPRIEDIIKERILILDGAMGTMLQSYGLEEKDFRGEQFADIPGPMARRLPARWLAACNRPPVKPMAGFVV